MRRYTRLALVVLCLLGVMFYLMKEDTNNCNKTATTVSDMSKERDNLILTTQTRVKYQNKMCAKLQETKIHYPMEGAIHFHQTIYKKLSLFRCLAYKTGSTLVTKILKTAVTYNNNPHQTKTGGGHVREIKELLNDSYTKVILVRDPYTRLLSTYINKFFNVKTDFLPYGNKIASIIRKHPRNPDNCIHQNIKFNEFMKYVVHETKTAKSSDDYDRHWLPYSLICSSCDIDYNFIVKFETLNEDLKTLWKLKNIKVSHEVIEMVKALIAGTEIDQIYQSGTCDVSTSQLINGYERQWVGLQMKGKLSYNSQFPHDNLLKNSDKFVFQRFIHEKRRKHEYSSSREDKTAMEAATIRAAYRSVDKHTMDEFRRLFYPDFYIYGYDLYPEYLREDGNVSYRGWTPFRLKTQY